MQSLIACTNEDNVSLTFGNKFSPWVLVDITGLYSFENDVATNDNTMTDGAVYLGSTTKKRNIVMKGQLTTDAAGHLQTEIDAKKLKIKTLTVPSASVVANTDSYATATPPYPYCYDFALAEMTDNTAAKVKPQTDADYASFIKYANGANYTSAGSIRIYFKKQPTEDLNVKIEYAEGTVM